MGAAPPPLRGSPHANPRAVAVLRAPSGLAGDRPGGPLRGAVALRTGRLWLRRVRYRLGNDLVPRVGLVALCGLSGCAGGTLTRAAHTALAPPPVRHWWWVAAAAGVPSAFGLRRGRGAGSGRPGFPPGGGVLRCALLPSRGAGLNCLPPAVVGRPGAHLRFFSGGCRGAAFF